MNTLTINSECVRLNAHVQWNAFTCASWTSSERVFMFACLWAALHTRILDWPGPVQPFQRHVTTYLLPPKKSLEKPLTEPSFYKVWTWFCSETTLTRELRRHTPAPLLSGNFTPAWSTCKVTFIEEIKHASYTPTGLKGQMPDTMDTIFTEVHREVCRSCTSRLAHARRMTRTQLFMHIVYVCFDTFINS